VRAGKKYFALGTDMLKREIGLIPPQKNHHHHFLKYFESLSLG
jgi:hypothetical protein